MRTSPAFSSPASRRTRALVACVLLGSTTLNACYVNVPVARTPTSGSMVALQLNDRGRVAMERALGPSVDRVDAAVVSGTPEEYVLAVRQVVTLDGNSSTWAGEQVTLRREFLRQEAERRFSRGRTIAAVGAGAAAIGAFILTRTLTGRSSEDPDKLPKPPEGNPTRQRTRLP